MDFSGWFANVGGAVGLFGGAAGILSWLNQRKQTKVQEGQLEVMREQFEDAKRQAGTATEWARKFDEAADALIKISPRQITIGPSANREAFAFVFSDEDLRRRIQIYLGRRKIWFHKFMPAILGNEQLSNPVIQETIRDVLNAVAQFKRDHTDFARALKLL